MSKWLTWKAPIFSPSPKSEPPKPPKPTLERLDRPNRGGFGVVADGEKGSAIFSLPPRSEPPKPPKPTGEGPEEGSVGFVGAVLGESSKIERARAALDRAGVRFLTIGGERVAGVWSDRDGERVREALREVGAGALPVRYLDGPGVPDHWKGRLTPGEPVPLNVLDAMMRATGEPWRVRDEMLVEMRWRPEKPRR